MSYIDETIIKLLPVGQWWALKKICKDFPHKQWSLNFISNMSAAWWSRGKHSMQLEWPEPRLYQLCCWTVASKTHIASETWWWTCWTF